MLGMTGSGEVCRTLPSVDVQARIIRSILWLQKHKLHLSHRHGFARVEVSVPGCCEDPQLSVCMCVCAGSCVYKILRAFTLRSCLGFLPCVVSQASDMWICGLTAEEFITDNYVRMGWKRNKPRTVWAGRCRASAYTVPCAPCAPCTPAHTLELPLGLPELERAAEETQENPNQLRRCISPQCLYLI